MMRYQVIRCGPSATLGASCLSFTRSCPMDEMAWPAFRGNCFAMYFRIVLARRGPLPLVLTMTCNGPSLWTLPK